MFTDGAADKAWFWTRGQPWQVDALAHEAVANQLKSDYAKIVHGSTVDLAAEALIQGLNTHINCLLERLNEPRVRRVIEPVIVGDNSWENAVNDGDIQHAKDLGLIKQDKWEYQPTNPIYGEVIVRALTKRLQVYLPEKLANRWISGRKFDLTGPLKSFQEFWRENSERLEPLCDCKEAASHLVCLANLRRFLNGGVEALRRECALGRERPGLEARYNGVSYLVGLKNKSRGRSFDTQKALEQMGEYMEKLEVFDGWLVVFDRGPEKSWDEKIFWETMQIR